WTNASADCPSVSCAKDNSQSFSIMVAADRRAFDSDFWGMLNDWIVDDCYRP
ncbi:hypothetical protein Ancab_001844, partial [Ancistrocladus abbreviatus]